MLTEFSRIRSRRKFLRKSACVFLELKRKFEVKRFMNKSRCASLIKTFHIRTSFSTQNLQPKRTQKE